MAELVRAAAPQVQVLTLGENVSSMTASAREKFSRVLGSVPVDLCASGCSPAKRPRLYWLNWPLGPETPEFKYEDRGDVIVATLHGQWPSWADKFERGARRPQGEESAWATFVCPCEHAMRSGVSPMSVRSSIVARRLMSREIISWLDVGR